MIIDVARPTVFVQKRPRNPDIDSTGLPLHRNSCFGESCCPVIPWDSDRQLRLPENTVHLHRDSVGRSPDPHPTGWQRVSVGCSHIRADSGPHSSACNSADEGPHILIDAAKAVGTGPPPNRWRPRQGHLQCRRRSTPQAAPRHFPPLRSSQLC